MAQLLHLWEVPHVFIHALALLVAVQVLLHKYGLSQDLLRGRVVLQHSYFPHQNYVDGIRISLRSQHDFILGQKQVIHVAHQQQLNIVVG